MTEKNDAQKQRITGITTQQDLQGSVKFSNQLIAIQSQTPEGIVYAKTFLDDLAQTPLSGKVKETFRKAFKTIIKETKNKADTPEGRSRLTALHLMVGTGLIDTRAELDAIHESAASGLIDYLPSYADRYYIDPKGNENMNSNNFNIITVEAEAGVSQIVQQLMTDQT